MESGAELQLAPGAECGDSGVESESQPAEAQLESPPAAVSHLHQHVDDEDPMRAILTQHEATVRTSYSDKNAYMRFYRQAKGKRKAIPSNLVPRFASDRQSLFLDFVEANEDWGVVSVMEMKRQIHVQSGTTQYRLMNRRELLERYPHDAAFVDHIIETKRRQQLASPDPDCPESRAHDYFYCRDLVVMTFLFFFFFI